MAKFGVVVFPGSNCDHDMLYVLEHTLKQKAIPLWHKETNLQGCEAIILPGGFSFGDYLRSGALSKFSPIMNEVSEFSKAGGYVFGICNGFQVLCESGLLPGALLANTSRKFSCKNVFLSAQNDNTALTKGIPKGKVLNVPIAHGEGRFYTDAATLEAMNRNGQVVFRYCSSKGEITDAGNPNGSIDNIAGICNEAKNVFGMMPHPERAADELLNSTDGLLILNSLVNTVKNKKPTFHKSASL
ncbi:MAG TPA: phosphoribosylformylglycinamidine synthase subunit PurQ [Bacteroidia bacterium]|jgi:phosphoribosylformylglycinamidine synthase I|nr:phosphoribosylformylglycinamidine synthase subunit PurQ [Bacteroidia bacterium]